MKRRKAIACDFDGTLCDTRETYPYPKGEPNWKLIRYLKASQAEGAGLILWTCREDFPLELAVELSASWGIVWDAVNENLPELREFWGNNPRKVYADEYYDDRAVHVDFISNVDFISKRKAVRADAEDG